MTIFTRYGGIAALSLACAFVVARWDSGKQSPEMAAVEVSQTLLHPHTVAKAPDRAP